MSQYICQKYLYLHNVFLNRVVVMNKITVRIGYWKHIKKKEMPPVVKSKMLF